jgi:hypothetical protein
MLMELGKLRRGVTFIINYQCLPRRVNANPGATRVEWSSACT